MPKDFGFFIIGVLLVSAVIAGCSDFMQVRPDATSYPRAGGDVSPATLYGVLESTNELHGDYGQKFTIIGSNQDLAPFVGKNVRVEAVVVETSGQPDIKVESIEAVR